MTSRVELIRRCLAEGPATSVELSVTLNLSRRRVRVGLWILQTELQVRSKPGIRIKDERGYPLKLYELTARGRAKAKGAAA